VGTQNSPKIKTPKPKPPKSKLQDPIKIPRSKIKTPRSKPPKPKLQDPNPRNQNSKIQTPKIKTPRSKPPKSKLQKQNLHQFLVHDRSAQKIDMFFFANHQHNEQNIKMEITKKKLQSSVHKRLFLENLEQTPKMR